MDMVAPFFDSQCRSRAVTLPRRETVTVG